jgi:hypothetical protein
MGRDRVRARPFLISGDPETQAIDRVEKSMQRSRQQSVLLAVCALAVILLLGLLAWISTSGRDGPSPTVVTSAPGPRAAGAPSDLTAPPVTDTPARAEIEGAPAEKPRPHAETAAQPAKTGSVTLVALFTRPDNADLELAAGVIELRDARGTVRRVDVQQQRSARITELAPDRYIVRVIAPDMEHRQQFLDLTREADASATDRGELVFEKRLILWPQTWIAVIVECTDGRPLAALAEDLGYAPMRLFVDAFQVHTQLNAPGAPSPEPAPDLSTEMSTGLSQLAHFRPPSEYKSWELTKSCVGSLELLHAPPLWVELYLFGKSVGWESLQVGAHEVVFRIDRGALDERFASVKARIVDPKDHAPVAQAHVTLRADTSAHRREDLTDRPSGNDGRIELARIVPGRYEFQVSRGWSQHQQMIELAPGEKRDLGDIALADVGGFDVLVVDDAGKPANAWVEIGPYEKGAQSTEIYPQMMRHSAGADGRARLPMPSDVAIVRAAVAAGRSNGPDYTQEVRGVRSANVLLDPRSPPQGAMRLTLKEPVKVLLKTKHLGGARIEVLDELDVVVAKSVKDTDKKLEAELVPGRYTARTVAADGTVGLVVPFVADGKQGDIAVD